MFDVRIIGQMANYLSVDLFFALVNFQGLEHVSNVVDSTDARAGVFPRLHPYGVIFNSPFIPPIY